MLSLVSVTSQPPAGPSCDGAVAAAALEDDLEEVDDAVLVGVEVVVVDVGVSDDGRVVRRLGRRAAAGVDGLQRADAGERADDRGAVGVRAVVGAHAGQLVPAVGDALGVGGRRGAAGRVDRRDAGAGVDRGRVDRRELQVVLGGDRAAVDADGADGAVREELPERHLLVEVERRGRVLRVVDDRLELRGVGVVLEVAVVDRDDRERAVAVARRLEAAARRDDLRAVAGDLLRRPADGDARDAGDVAPDDRRLLRRGLGLGLEDQRDGRAGRDRRHRPGDRAAGQLRRADGAAHAGEGHAAGRRHRHRDVARPGSCRCSSAGSARGSCRRA